MNTFIHYGGREDIERLLTVATFLCSVELSETDEGGLDVKTGRRLT